MQLAAAPPLLIQSGHWVQSRLAALALHDTTVRNCSELRGSEDLKGANRGRIPVADAQADGYQTAFVQFDPRSLNSYNGAHRGNFYLARGNIYPRPWNTQFKSKI